MTLPHLRPEFKDQQKPFETMEKDMAVVHRHTHPDYSPEEEDDKDELADTDKK